MDRVDDDDISILSIHRYLKIIMEIVRDDVDFLGMIKSLDARLLNNDNHLIKFFLDKFRIICIRKT